MASQSKSNILADKTVQELLRAIEEMKSGDEIAETQGMKSAQVEVLHPVKSQGNFVVAHCPKKPGKDLEQTRFTTMFKEGDKNKVLVLFDTFCGEEKKNDPVLTIMEPDINNISSLVMCLFAF